MSGLHKLEETEALSDNETFEDALEDLEDKLTNSVQLNEQKSSHPTTSDPREEKSVEVTSEDGLNSETDSEVSGKSQDELTDEGGADSNLKAEEGLGDKDEDEGVEDKTDADAECEENLRERDAHLTEEQLEEFYQKALELKLAGNEEFKSGEFSSAVDKYTEAIYTCPLCHVKDRSILYSNRAAAFLRQDKNEKAISDCTKAVELNPNYLKALLRRAELYEKTEKLDEALSDYQKALEMDPSLVAAREACLRLPDVIKERNEKMKEEMMGKLKELGNMVLRPFGLSTNNFKLQQDPNTGSYSVQFQQNAQPS